LLEIPKIVALETEMHIQILKKKKAKILTMSAKDASSTYARIKLEIEMD